MGLPCSKPLSPNQDMLQVHTLQIQAQQAYERDEQPGELPFKGFPEFPALCALTRENRHVRSL